MVLAAVAGVPAIPGVWLGGFAFDPTMAAIAFGVAAGVGAGFLAMYLTGLVTL